MPRNHNNNNNTSNTSNTSNTRSRSKSRSKSRSGNMASTSSKTRSGKPTAGAGSRNTASSSHNYNEYNEYEYGNEFNEHNTHYNKRKDKAIVDQVINDTNNIKNNHKNKNKNKNKNKPSPHFDYSSGDSSTISSAFTHSSASTWSVPRNRTHYYSQRRDRNVSDTAGPRRNRGPGFRVSLRPTRHRTTSSNASTVSSSDESVVELCVRGDAAFWNRMSYLVILIVLMVALVHVESRINYFSNFYDKIALSEDDRLEKVAESIAVKALEEITLKANLRAAATLKQEHDAASAQNYNNNDQNKNNILLKAIVQEATSRIADADADDVARPGSTIQKDKQIEPPFSSSSSSPQLSFDKSSVSQTGEEKANDIESFYDNIYKNKRKYNPEQVLEGHTALRMVENAPLATGNETDDDDDDDDERMNTNSSTSENPENSTAPERLDWSPTFQPPQNPFNTTVVAYVLPVFTCYKLSSQSVNSYGFNEPSSDEEFRDAALMLQASVHQNSIRNPDSNSSYDYEMVALIHRGIQSCHGGANRTTILQSIGYRVEVVREPIHPVNIVDEYLRNHAPRNNGGRAGMREMIRLYAFKMVEYPIAVLVDTTTWMLHPPDAIYDTLLNGAHGHEWAESHPDHIVRDTFYPNGTITSSLQLPTELDIMFSRDYSTMQQGDWTTGVSLAFLPIRPSAQRYKQLINTYQNTPYNERYGWNSKGYTKYAGSMQTKGLITYFFSEIHPERKLELNRCIYNNLADVPYIAGSSRGGKDNCRDVKEHKKLPDGITPMPCTDCRIQEWGKIVVANFGICQVPWVCPWIENPGNIPLLIPTLNMCRRYHEHWFALRKITEELFLDESYRTKTKGTFHSDVFKGYCMPGGERGGSYVSMEPSVALPNGFGNSVIPLLDM